MNLKEKLAVFTGWLLGKPKVIGLCVFLFLLMLIGLLVIQRYQIIKEGRRLEMANALNVVKQNVQLTLNNGYAAALTLALTLNEKGVPENFEAVGAKLMESNPDYQVLEMLPQGVIKYLYPLKGNELAMNLDLFKKTAESRLMATQSKLSKTMYYAGPYELQQGGMGVIGRLPIYRNNKFWGFSAVVIKQEAFFNSIGVYKDKGNDFYFQFSKLDVSSGKEHFILEGDTSFFDRSYQYAMFPNTNWKLYIIPADDGKIPFLFVYPLLFALCLAALSSLLVVQVVKKTTKLQTQVYSQKSELINTETKFKTIFDQAAIGIALITPAEGRFLQVNKKLCEIMGYKESELLELGFQNITFPNQLNGTVNNINSLREGKIKEYRVQKKYVHKEGHVKWCNIVETPLWNDDGTPSSHIVIVEDVTDRKAAEKIVLDSQLRIESLINTIDGIVWEADPNTFEFTFISKKVEDILGYSAEEWLSCPTFWVDHIYPEDRDWAIDYCAVSTRNNVQHDFEYRMIAKDGSVVWLRDIVNVISEDGKPILLRGIMIDVGENKEAQDALKDSFDLVTEQNKRLLNFSYIVSHNLRSHTSNIQAITNLIGYTNSEEERTELIEVLKTVSGLLNETMLNLNKVVNIQTSIDVIKEPLSLNNYINKTIDILNDQILLKNAIINNKVPIDVIVNYNPAYLESILLNFIFNAIRYSHPDRNPVVELVSFIEDSQTVLQISDNGIGIDLEKHGEELYGLYKTFNKKPDSKGVGLFITKNQIDAMGGKVIVSSVVNQGTTFKIHFK
ncbi:PAS domain S-box protein [Pedobacter foliorum]|uniref:PAS domain S-box protein n=1 Tax=Pedobacter foliorum TaxID=2739058 RepID=UPI001564B503|nr:PAS domain S-box protein [Pedobacter foliorum]NRF40784.1 PAS domain S-box protein [Pedobacter foliorum]